MSDDSSDCSDINVQPSSSKGRQQGRKDQKRKRRIVMRIEFDDSDDSTSVSDRSSEDEENYVKTKNNRNNDGSCGVNELGDDAPSCSENRQLRNRQIQNKICNENDSNDSDEFQRNAATRRLRRGGRSINVLDVGHSDGSTSGSEVKINFISNEDTKSKSIILLLCIIYFNDLTWITSTVS